KMALEHGRKAGEIGLRHLDERFVCRSELELRLGNCFEGEETEGLIEVCYFPELPAYDIGAFLRVTREQGVAARLVGKALRDCVRFPEHKRAVHQQRDHPIGIEREISGCSEIAANKILIFDLDL